MRIVTISREFGSGGRELGKRLADLLEFDYYDKEIISSISKNKGIDECYVENVLNNQGWKSFPITFRKSFSVLNSVNNLNMDILLEQNKIIKEIASLGKDFVIVGRNADVLLSEEKPFNIFVCADMESKIDRCIERANESEGLKRKEIEKNIINIDKNRAKTREIITDSLWGDPKSYHLVVNTTEWEIKKLAESVKDFVISFWENK